MSRNWVVLFDWDGTLIQSLELKIHNAGMLFEEALELPFTPVEQAYRRHSGIPRRQLFEAICADNGLPPLDDAKYMELSRRFSEMNHAALTDPQMEGLVPADTFQILAMLAKREFPTYVSSSAETKEIQGIARVLRLEPFFTEILGSAPGFSKGKEHISYVRQKHGVSLSQMVFVGDEPADIKLGRAAGVLTVARIGTHPLERLAEFKPDYMIRSLNELPALLDGENSN